MIRKRFEPEDVAFKYGTYSAKYKKMRRGRAVPWHSVFMLMMFLCYASAVISLLWAAVSYINYLVKDIPFNFDSLYCAASFFVSAVLFMALTYVKLSKKINDKL